MNFPRFDAIIIHRIRRLAIPTARIALFIVFFWFGVLKIMGVSPADPLVEALLKLTLPFVPFDSFRVFFGIYEMIIGASFLLPGFERLAIAMLLPHMAATFLPLIFLPGLTWAGLLVPTLAGQYIIKNLIIIALALSLAAHLHPAKDSRK